MKNKHRRIIRLLILLIVIACGVVVAVKFLPLNILRSKSTAPEAEFVNQTKIRNTAPNSLFFDFEVDPKTANEKLLYKGIAHSGLFSAKTFGKNSYSIIIERKAAEVGLDNLKAIALSAWIYVFPGKNKVESSLVFTASNNGVNLTWKGVTMHDADIQRGKWFKISGAFNLSEIPFQSDSKLQIYFWNNSSNDILMDDLSIVFGKAQERRGDSARVDMTKGIHFTPSFNSPPYPFHYFGKEEIGNDNSKFLVKKDKLKEGEILLSDKVITGHFATSLPGMEDVLIVKNDGRTELFSFAKEDRVFQKSMTSFPPEAEKMMGSATILKGAFSGKTNDQLLLIGSNSILLCTPGKAVNGNQLTWKAGKVILPWITEVKGTTTVSADLKGDGFSELLAVRPDGTWKIFSFREGTVHPVITGPGSPALVPGWNADNTEMKISAGKFLQKYSQDLLLTVFREKGKKEYSYSLVRFDPASGTFVSCFTGKNKPMGMTIGLDTLKPTDAFITGIFDNKGPRKVFRYNRDWRYDLKEIQFSDTSFRIIANIDFTGYAGDHNPKYFESLRIQPGMILYPNRPSLLLIQRNPANPGSKALPDAIQVYSFSNTDK
jgi:hypothetical protein